jgi:hypothetical protein
MWTLQKAQTLQQSRNHIKYFPVRETCSNSHVNNATSLIQSTVNQAIQQHKEHHLQRHQIVNNESGKDTPWLNNTGWKRRFADMDMVKLVAMSRLELVDEEIWLKDVEQQVCQMIEDAYLGKSLLTLLTKVFLTVNDVDGG